MNLIIGGSGTLGNYLKLAHENLNIKIMSPSSKELDITSLSSCKMYFQNHSNIKKVYFLAAMTDVDECEKNPKLAYKINVQGLRNFLDVISPDMRFIYISTSAVFGGSSQKYNYSEMDRIDYLDTAGKNEIILT